MSLLADTSADHAHTGCAFYRACSWLVEQIAQVEVLAQASADAAVCAAAARVHIPTGGHILELGMQFGKLGMQLSWRLARS